MSESRWQSPGPDGSHGGGLVAGVGLCRVLKVRVRSAGTVHADVARHVDVRAAVRLAHHGHHSDLRFPILNKSKDTHSNNGIETRKT